jgi:hypothetical protein
MTSAHSRKASSNHLPSLSSVPPVPNVGGEKSDFIVALQVMNEATMENACLLLLSERDYDEKEGGNNNNNNNNNEEPSDHDKLWEIYSKCENAFSIIKKQQPTEPQTPNLMTGAPSLPPPPKRGVGGVGGLLKQKPGIGNKPGVIPMRRTTHLQHKGTSTPGAASLKRGIERDQGYVPDGDAPPASAERSSAGSSSKKPRTSPPTTLRQVSTPPASALNFLAKLNKDPKEQEKKQQKEPPPPPPNKRSNRRSTSA